MSTLRIFWSFKIACHFISSLLPSIFPRRNSLRCAHLFHWRVLIISYFEATSGHILIYFFWVSMKYFTRDAAEAFTLSVTTLFRLRRRRQLDWYFQRVAPPYFSVVTPSSAASTRHHQVIRFIYIDCWYFYHHRVRCWRLRQTFSIVSVCLHQRRRAGGRLSFISAIDICYICFHFVLFLAFPSYLRVYFSRRAIFLSELRHWLFHFLISSYRRLSHWSALTFHMRARAGFSTPFVSHFSPDDLLRYHTPFFINAAISISLSMPRFNISTHWWRFDFWWWTYVLLIFAQLLYLLTSLIAYSATSIDYSVIDIIWFELYFIFLLIRFWPEVLY